uniref:Protein kinase domain-containing protein n=1 Tax=Rhabditophanes sp. KR3021 TaxID=114890 RepID=A0AC35U569_9BILA
MNKLSAIDAFYLNMLAQANLEYGGTTIEELNEYSRSRFPKDQKDDKTKDEGKKGNAEKSLVNKLKTSKVDEDERDMPLANLFGVGSSSSLKPQPLSNEKKEKSGSLKSGLMFNYDYNKNASSSGKKNSVKLNKTTYTIEKKIAEGGFAIVFLVHDKQNRNFALKRQLIRDDNFQLESCKREATILKQLVGHKNIVNYETHIISQNKTGISEYMLITAYYSNSVFQLMNEKLKNNSKLLPSDVRDIFRDMCKAVHALHTSSPPIIHRDLKVENILIDEHTYGKNKPIYVLCDFGSCTSSVLSIKTHDINHLQEEINRYTTLSYRAPEMIELYYEVPIGTKSDIWALGVLLYKLCYFQLPFGESNIAIQGGEFTFPEGDINTPETIKALISFCLTTDHQARPDIWQVSCLLYEMIGQPNPLKSIKNSPIMMLDDVFEVYKDRFLTKTSFNSPYIARTRKTVEPVSLSRSETSRPAMTDKEPKNEMIINTNAINTNITYTGSTTVNPRLRPKPINSVSMLPNKIAPSINCAHEASPTNSINNVQNNVTIAKDPQPTFRQMPNNECLLRSSAFK